MSLPVLRQGDSGSFVAALQRDYVHLGYHLAVDGAYGPQTTTVTRSYQQRAHLTVDGIVGPETWRRISSDIARGSHPQPQAPPSSKEAITRASIVKAARYAIAHEPSIHYTEGSQRMGWVRAWKHNRSYLPLPAWEDCSSSTTGIYCVSGAPDPNGLGYNGEGYTGTMLSHMHHIPFTVCKMGDLIVYGPGTGHHVCLVLEGGTDPLLYSHGFEGGPIAIRHSTEQRNQPSPATGLTLPSW